MKNTEKAYWDIINKCKEIFSNKMKDYGSAWRILRKESLTDQIYIKAQRIRSIQQQKTQKINEGQYEEFIGIINYAVMALIQIEKGVVDAPDLDQKNAITLYEAQVNIIFELMLNKNHDYGEAWRNMRVSSLTDLILQKILRIKQIENNEGKVIVSEGIDANYHDIVNYAVFAMIHLDGEKV